AGDGTIRREEPSRPELLLRRRLSGGRPQLVFEHPLPFLTNRRNRIGVFQGDRSMRKTAFRNAFICVASCIASVAFGQQTPSISVTGAVKQPLTLTAADLATMPRAKAVTDSNGIQTTYEGVWLGDVLKKAGVPLGAGLRGAALAGYVLASASDGYQVVF